MSLGVPRISFDWVEFSSFFLFFLAVRNAWDFIPVYRTRSLREGNLTRKGVKENMLAPFPWKSNVHQNNIRK